MSHGLLWTAEQLKRHAADPTLRLIDVRSGEHFARGHIPGAHHFNLYGLNVYDTDEAPLQSFVRMWAFLLGRSGVTRNDQVIFYEEDSGMTAARGFWFLEYLGHEKVHLLDGGLRAWRDAGLELTQEAEPPSPAVYEYRVNPDRIATYREMLAAIGASEKIILDTRSDEEWFGSDRRAERGGTIPSSLHLEWTQMISSSGRFKSRADLEQILLERGITPEHEVLPFCNTGYRSAHVYLALRLLGYPRVRNYVGSWQEWGNREGLPVVIPDNERTAPSS